MAADASARGAQRRAPLSLVALAAMVIAYVAVFGTLTWQQQSNLGTFGFDMGIYDQAIWLLSRFRAPFVTVRGLQYFGHHVNPVTLLFVPAYWLGAGPHFLYLVETVWMALGAVPLWLLARDRLGAGVPALVVPACYLLYPSLEWINWWHFHPDALAITPLLCAFWLATRARWGWFAAAVALTLACKEDAALAVVVLGLLVAWRYHRRLGVVTAAAGAAWFLACTRIVIPAATGGGGPFYEDFFPGLGTSLGEIARNLVVHPSRGAHLALQGDRRVYYLQLLAPVAFLPLAAVAVLAVGAPQLAVNVVSGFPYTHEIRYHYSSLVLAAIFLATVEALARLGSPCDPPMPPTSHQRGRLRLALGVLLAASLAANVAWSPSPLGVHYHTGIWPRPSPRGAAARRALATVPASAGVSATYYLVPQLTHRVSIYEFPNPWRACNWGLPGQPPADPRTVDYLVLDLALIKPHQPLYQRLVGPAGPFSVVFDEDGIVTAKRRPGQYLSSEPPPGPC